MYSDFMDERRAVVYHGRRIDVSRPTLKTVWLALLHLGGEILAIRRALATDAGLGPDPIAASIEFFLMKESALGLVLRSCCTNLNESEPIELMRTLCYVVAEISDIPRIAKSLALPEELPDSIEAITPAGPSEAEVELVSVCQAMNLSPAEIHAFPYELYLTTLESLAILRDRRERARTTPAGLPEWLTPDNCDLPGIVATEIPKS